MNYGYGSIVSANDLINNPKILCVGVSCSFLISTETLEV